MPRQTKIAKPAPQKTEEVEKVKSEADQLEDLKAQTDELLDEIDGLLEEQAEEFVRNYIQKGGE